MKIVLSLILPTLLLLPSGARSARPSMPSPSPNNVVSAQSSDAAGTPSFTKTVIDPGLSVGPLKLGDPPERAMQLFPKKDEDQQWEDSCGTTIDWVDSTNPVGRGDLLIRFKKGKIFQIESATTRFHTAEDITTFDSPEKVASAYKELRAYTLLTPPSPALGDRPLVFWVSKKKGIAFTLAYDPGKRKRYIYKITVFEPGKNFCPEQETNGSSKFQEIRPYAVEPPIELSPESTN